MLRTPRGQRGVSPSWGVSPPPRRGGTAVALVPLVGSNRHLPPLSPPGWVGGVCPSTPPAPVLAAVPGASRRVPRPRGPAPGWGVAGAGTGQAAGAFPAFPGGRTPWEAGDCVSPPPPVPPRRLRDKSGGRRGGWAPERGSRPGRGGLCHGEGPMLRGGHPMGGPNLGVRSHREGPILRDPSNRGVPNLGVPSRGDHIPGGVRS